MLTFDDPRLWYRLFIAIYMAIGCVYFASALLDQPFTRKKTLFILASSVLFVWAWNTVGGIYLNIYMPGFYSGFLLLLILVYRQDWRNAIFLALIHYFSIAYIPRAMWWLYGLVGGRVQIQAGISYWDEPWIHFLTAFTMFVIIYFIRKQIKNIANYKFQGREFNRFLIIILPFSIISYLLSFSKMSPNVPFGLIMIWPILSLGLILNMVSWRKQQQELWDMHIIEKHLQDQYQRHLMKIETSDLIMQKCHDLQKHLRLFQETQNRNHLEAYQDELKTTISDFDSVYETGNAVLDAVLSESSRKCRANNIQLVCLVDGELIKFIEPIDIYSIFGNALENAIESSINLSDDKKIIQLKIYQENFLLYIRVTNYYKHTLVWSNGNILTGKPDQLSHGYGLKSIKYAVEKYGGNMEINANEGKFNLSILFNR